MNPVKSPSVCLCACSEHILRVKGVNEASGGANSSVPIILVGNKVDLVDRKVSRDEAEERARLWGVKYVECSAKDKQTVEQVTFIRLLFTIHCVQCSILFYCRCYYEFIEFSYKYS